jgi:hypothetical protein
MHRAANDRSDRYNKPVVTILAAAFIALAEWLWIAAHSSKAITADAAIADLLNFHHFQGSFLDVLVCVDLFIVADLTRRTDWQRQEKSPTAF